MGQTDPSKRTDLINAAMAQRLGTGSDRALLSLL